jgi:hypothetical protein
VGSPERCGRLSSSRPTPDLRSMAIPNPTVASICGNIELYSGVEVEVRYGPPDMKKGVGGFGTWGDNCGDKCSITMECLTTVRKGKAVQNRRQRIWWARTPGFLKTGCSVFWNRVSARCVLV